MLVEGQATTPGPSNETVETNGAEFLGALSLGAQIQPTQTKNTYIQVV